jgi:hypothetical protein
MEGETDVTRTSPHQHPFARRAERGRGLGDRERVAPRLRRAASPPPRLRLDLLRHRGGADLPARRRAVHEESGGARLRAAGGAAHLRQPELSPHPAPDRVHAGGLRALLRADGGRAPGGGAARMGLAANPRVHHPRSAHRRAPRRWAMIRALDDGRLRGRPTLR